MKLVTFQRRTDSPRAGILLDDGRVMDAGRAYAKTLEPASGEATDTQRLLTHLRGLSGKMIDIIRGGDVTLTHFFGLARRASEPELADCIYNEQDVTLLPPVLAPPCVLHFEANESFAHLLASHLGYEEGAVAADWFRYPIFNYGAAPLISGPKSITRFPAGEDRIDFELELACVLAEPVRDASPEDAEDAILGYTIANEWTARSLQARFLPCLSGSAKAKSVGVVLGPAIVTKEEVGNPYKLTTRVSINGDIAGEGSTDCLRYRFPEMISYASEGVTLPAGTLITSGALSGGSGLELGRFLKPGDMVEQEIDKLGMLVSSVHEREQPPLYQPRDI